MTNLVISIFNGDGQEKYLIMMLFDVISICIAFQSQNKCVDLVDNILGILSIMNIPRKFRGKVQIFNLEDGANREFHRYDGGQFLHLIYILRHF